MTRTNMRRTTSLMTLPSTCFAHPWVLIKRGGTTPGNRPATRMAYLVDTIAPKGTEGTAVAVTGYIMSASLANWTRHPQRIEWHDIVARWHRPPNAAAIQAARLQALGSPRHR